MNELNRIQFVCHPTAKHRRHYVNADDVKVVLSRLFLIVTLILAGCASRYQLPSFKQTDGYVNRQIEVRTKQGQKYRLISYQITSTKIIGKDKEGNQHEELVENVQSITVIYKQKVVDVVFAGTIVFVAFMVFLWATLLSSL